MRNPEFNLALLEAGLSKIAHTSITFEEQGSDISDLHSFSLIGRPYLIGESRTDKPADGIIRFHVKKLTGETILVGMRRPQTIEDLMKFIEDMEGTPLDEQRLFFGGRRLKSSKTIGECDIRKGTTVHMVSRCSGEGFAMPFAKRSLDPMYDFDFTRMRDDGCILMRGDEVYKRPYGWYQYAVKVVGKYGSNAWFGLNEMGHWAPSREWPMAYHGTSLWNGMSIDEAGDDFSSSNRMPYGNGIYTTPDIDYAEKFAQEFYHNGERYLIVIQNRVSPWFVRKFTIVRQGMASPKQLWLSVGEDDVRAYGFLVKKVRD